MTALSALMNPSSLWLLIWMINNIGVTLLNKAAFAKVDFRYPWFLSAIHMLCNYCGSLYIFYSIRNTNMNSTNRKNDDTIHLNEKQPLIVRLLGGQQIQRKELDKDGYKIMLAFSILFTLNIAIGNVSLRYVTVNFNQVMRSLVPAVTIALGLCLGKKFSLQRKLAVLPIMMGVAMACFGDMSYTALGFIVTAICVLLAALKAVASGEMLTGSLKMHPVDLLGHMAPLALIQCLIVSACSGEVSAIARRWHTELSPITADPYPMFVVFMSGIASFTLNISSLQANKLTSPLTLCIAANVKQVLMIWLGTIMFETPISPLNGAGIVVVLLGSARYSYVCITEKKVTPLSPNEGSGGSVAGSHSFKLLDDKHSERTNADDDDDDVKDIELNNDVRNEKSKTNVSKTQSSNGTNHGEMVSLLNGNNK